MHRSTVGNIEMLSILDAGFVSPVEGVFPEAGDAIQPYAEFLTPEGQISMGDNCFVLRVDGQTILIDTGLGPGSNGQLIAELDAAGIGADGIDILAFTHLHGDHTGWNIDADSGEPRFTNARFLVPRGDWDHYAAQGGGSFERDVAPLEASGRLELIEGDHPVVPAVLSVSTPGHTPGHLSYAVTSGGERAFILGDVVLTPIDVREPDWKNVYDSDDDLARQTRHAVLDRLVSSGELVGSSHMPAPGVGHFVEADGVRSWRAV